MLVRAGAISPRVAVWYPQRATPITAARLIHELRAHQMEGSRATGTNETLSVVKNTASVDRKPNLAAEKTAKLRRAAPPRKRLKLSGRVRETRGARRFLQDQALESRLLNHVRPGRLADRRSPTGASRGVWHLFLKHLFLKEMPRHRHLTSFLDA